MKTRTVTSAAVLTLTFGAVGCGGTGDHRASDGAVEASGEASSELVSNNRLAQNRLAQNRLAQNRLAQNRLAQNRLASNRLASNRLASNRLQLDSRSVGDLLATEDGREVMKYVVECALPTGYTLVGSANGESYEFAGGIGLAPAWLVAPLDREGQRWVSACLFARVNAVGVSVQISMRGPQRALATSPDEMATWTLEEGAFWGNYFASPDEPIDWNACRGIDQAAGETGDLVNRHCTEPDPENPGYTLCGFQGRRQLRRLRAGSRVPWLRPCRSLLRALRDRRDAASRPRGHHGIREAVSPC